MDFIWIRGASPVADAVFWTSYICATSQKSLDGMTIAR